MSLGSIDKTFRTSLRIYSSIITVAGIGHIAWYWFFPTYNEMTGLTEVQWSTFYLFNWSISILLLFLSILSYLASWTSTLTLTHLRVYSALTIGFWICRLILEFVFPVRIPFVMIPNPSALFKTLIIIAILILAIPELRFRFRKVDSNIK